MFGLLASIIRPQQAARSSFFCPILSPSIPSTTIESHIMDLSKYTQCLSQWPEHLAPGLPTIGALLLLGTGGLVVACKVWSFLRVLLSLFVLPGKPVSGLPLAEGLRLSYTG